MANNNGGGLNSAFDREESNPLLNKNHQEQEKKPTKAAAESPVEKSALTQLDQPEYGWTANGLPLNHGSVVGEPMGRAQWNSSICACLGRNDEFCGSDLEVCKSSFMIFFVVRFGGFADFIKERFFFGKILNPSYLLNSKN